jgi:glycosyltransferase involved in cell wall biosynthesis
MRVSIGMATRNGERYLGPLLESLARQTRAPAELVVHDDASVDGTVAILEAFAARAPFPVRLEQAARRRAHVAGFLRAGELCESEAVAFCDQDDVWAERKLEVCLDALERSGATLAVHRVRVVDAELREIAPPWPALGATRVVPPLGFTGLHLDAPGMAMVFRRSLLDRADPARRPSSRYVRDGQMLHDEWVLFLAGVVGPIHLIADPLVLYRQHEDNVSGWFGRERRATLEPQMEDYRAAAEHTAEYARFLSALQVKEPGLAARIEAGARHYRHLADRWELRMALYGKSGRRARARLFGQLVAARAYGPRLAGGFGRRALGKDLVAGIALRGGRTA